MKTLSLRLLPAFSIVVMVASPCNRVTSCYYGPEFGDTNMVFFNPELGNDSIGLRPFFFTRAYLFDDNYDWHDGAVPDRVFSDFRQNCQEWQKYLGPGVDTDDVYEEMYESDADAFLTAVKTQTLGDYKPGNSFVKALKNPKNRAALAYYYHAKQFEFQQFELAMDTWAEDNQYYISPSYYADSMLLPQLTRNAAKQLRTAPDNFLRQRWAYQYINALFYMARDGVSDSLRTVFNQYFNLQKDKTVVLPWALLKVAEANPKQAEANFQLAQVFDRCESKRFRVLQLYVRGWEQQTVAYAQTRNERAAVLTLTAMRDPGRALPALRAIAQIAPGTPYLPLLLSREINKLENWLLTPRFSGGSGWHSFMPEFDWDENYDRKADRWIAKARVRDREYLREVRQFVETQVQKHRTPLLQLALAHLLYMEGGYEQSWQVLQNLRPAQHELYILQRNIQEILLIPQRMDVRTAQAKQALYRRLMYVRNHSKLLAEPGRQIARIHQALSHAYWRRGDVPTAGLLFSRAANYIYVESNHYWTNQGVISFYDNLAGRSDLEILERLLDKPNKSPFEQYITQNMRPEEAGGTYSEWQEYNFAGDSVIVPSKDELYELMGMLALRDGDLAYARKAMARVDTSYWRKMDKCWTVDITGSTAFVASDSLGKAGPAGMNKYQIVNKMYQLEREAAQNPARRAENYYLLGNAWYHCSYWGRAGSMLSYYRSVYDTDEPLRYRRSPAYLNSRLDPQRYGAIFYRCGRAAQYYRRALACQPNPELAARAYYMLAECDRRDRWMDERRKPDNERYEGGVSSPMFRTWAKRYRHTQAYRECISACPDLKVYLGQ